MRDNHPRDNEIEKEHWINGKGLSIRLLTVAHENHRSYNEFF